jgi:quercetin dioxygenase-like cupin family protein
MTPVAANAQTYQLLGLEIRILVSAAQTGGRYSVFETVLPPGAATPRHLHMNEDEWVMVVEGAVRALLPAGQMQTLGPGQSLFIAKNTFHTLEAAGDRPARVVAICLPAGFELFFPELDTLLKNAAGQDRTPDVATLAANFGMIVEQAG